MLYLLVVPIILLIVAYIGSRDLFVSKEARIVFMAGCLISSVALAVFILLSYSLNVPIFFIGCFLVLAFACSGIAVIETADNIEIKIRRLDKYTRESLDPFQ